MRPAQRHPQSRPFHHRPQEYGGYIRHWAKPHVGAESVRQMRDHLRRRHFAPAAWRVGPQLSEPITELLLAAFQTESFHAPNSPARKTLESQIAERNGSSARSLG